MSTIEEIEEIESDNEKESILTGGKRKMRGGRLDLSSEHFLATMKNSKSDFQCTFSYSLLKKYIFILEIILIHFSSYFLLSSSHKIEFLIFFIFFYFPDSREDYCEMQPNQQEI